MSLEEITFSAKLLREQNVRRHSVRHYLRFCALCLTLGEAVVVFFLFRRMDFLGCYAMAAYLAKEHVINRFTGHG